MVGLSTARSVLGTAVRVEYGNMPLNLNSFQFFSELPSRHDCDCWNIRGILSAVPRLCRLSTMTDVMVSALEDHVLTH